MLRRFVIWPSHPFSCFMGGIKSSDDLIAAEELNLHTLHRIGKV